MGADHWKLLGSYFCPTLYHNTGLAAARKNGPKKTRINDKSDSPQYQRTTKHWYPYWSSIWYHRLWSNREQQGPNLHLRHNCKRKLCINKYATVIEFEQIRRRRPAEKKKWYSIFCVVRSFIWTHLLAYLARSTKVLHFQT